MSEVHYYKSDDNVLAVEKKFGMPEGSFQFSSNREVYRKTIYIFDFEFSTVTALMHGARGGAEQSQVMPFSAMDDNVLTKMREKLVELGGNPPALSAGLPKKGLTRENVSVPAQKKGI